MSPRPLRVLLAALALGAPAALAGPAGAAGFGVTGFTVSPSTTQAGAAVDLRLRLSFASPGDDVKSLVVHLPPGLIGNPRATARCTRAAFLGAGCPAATQVGTTTASVRASLGVVPLPTTISAPGTVSNLAPSGSEPARLGIRLTPAGGVLGVIRLEAPVSVRPADAGLDTTLNDLPRSFNGVDTDILSLDLTLNARAGSPAATFLTLPTSCRPATLGVDATSYAAPGTTSSATAGLTPTGCDKLPFAPRVSAAAGERGATAPPGKPPLRVTVLQAAGAANLLRTSVLLPTSLGIDPTALGSPCSEAQLGAGSCPAASTLGSARVDTPLFAEPLQGPVRLVTGPPGMLPGLAIDLSGPISLRLRATTALGGAAGGQLRTTFDGLPDVPLSAFTLQFKGKGGPLVAAKDLCKAGGDPLVATLTGQNGKVATVAAPLVAEGCAGGSGGGGAGAGPGSGSGPGAGGGSPASRRPRATARLTRVRGSRPGVRVDVRTGGSPLRGVRLTLPSALRTVTARARRGARASAGGRALASRPRLTPRTLVVRGLPRVGSRHVILSLRGGALRRARSIRRGSTVVLRLRVVDRTGRATTLVLRPRAR